MNSLVNNLTNYENVKLTENGGIAYRSTMDKVLDMFALGASYRNRSKDDKILLFKEAYDQNDTLALKCLFYIGAVRDGAGERQFFKDCYHWLAENHPFAARRNLRFIPELLRWDVLYCLDGTPLEKEMYDFLFTQIKEDVASLMKGDKTPVSLCGKWLKSINASSDETRRLGRKTAAYFNMTEKEYRKNLAALRKRANVLECLITAGKYDEIDFASIPSKAGMKYRHMFMTRIETKERYEAFINNKETRVKSGTLYPYEIVQQTLKCRANNDVDRKSLQKFWDNLPDYLNGNKSKMMCMIDTSSSMTMGSPRPIDVAISLGLYCAERMGGDFKDVYMSFSTNPQFVTVRGTDLYDKVYRIYKNCIVDSTDMVKAFELLRVVSKNASPEDRIDTLVVISDMEINESTYSYHKTKDYIWTEENVVTEMEKEREKWIADGLEMPKLIYWNVNARNNTILEKGPLVSFVSGCSPIIFKTVLTGKSGYDLMIEALSANAFKEIC